MSCGGSEGEGEGWGEWFEGLVEQVATCMSVRIPLSFLSPSLPLSLVILRVGTDILFALTCMYDFKQEMLATAVEDGLLEVREGGREEGRKGKKEGGREGRKE